MTDNRRNWAGNYEYSAARFHFPETVEYVQELVHRCSKLRVLGTCHSFNGIADCTEDLISLEKLDQVSGGIAILPVPSLHVCFPQKNSMRKKPYSRGASAIMETKGLFPALNGGYLTSDVPPV